MIKEKRLKQLEEYVVKQQSASLDELVKEFNVSKNTIRRDLQELLDTGAFKKVYGGIAVNQKKLEHFQEREVQNHHEKRIIGRTAADFVEDGDIIFIDSGTTTIEMLHHIKEKSITIITNNIDIIVGSLPFENVTIITIGGVLERKTKSFGINYNVEMLNTYNINKAFMASTGLTPTTGVTNASFLETELKSKMVERSKTIFLLVDHTKFGQYGLTTYCELNKIDYLITDRMPSQEYQNLIEENHVQLVIAAE
ncbi:DeoR/GlpR family DNA-binding transcription regulator [Neobacillus niacini]|uniref:DeoR/GlpR family DNA-binding transcription regulator n=1 Tax=Neobacillus niacini TaxID=86668 RepID=UPI0007AB924E|nr:DeoR/GlpR family DNA-binding transcription regulator [Neobacillus niacini]MEC1524510.1 DeoR/GlpR family DNA-binding transcription regulator [Neobacillus niacini]